MKYRLFAFAAAVLTAISAMPYISAVAEETATNGSLSDNISWDYSVEDGVLSITGTGAVPAGEMGWADLKAHSSSWTYIDEDGNEQVHAYMGDVDCDGDLTLKDAVLLAKVIGNVSGVSLSAEGFANADLDGDGSILGGDLTVLLRQLAGM